MLAASLFSLLSSCLLYKNLHFKIYKMKDLPIALCGCQTWSLTLREEHRLRFSLKQGADLRGRKWREAGEDCIMGST